MRSPDDLRAKARNLYAAARATDSGDDGLLYVLRAIECEREADALEQGEVLPPFAVKATQPWTRT